MGLESLLRSARRVAGAAVLTAAGLVGVAAAPARPASAAPPVGVQGVVLSAADNHGLQGTEWHTTLWAEQDAVDQAMLTLCATNNSSPADDTDCQQFPLYKGRVLTLANAWAGFSAPPPGGLLWKVDGLSPDQVALFSRTYTLAPAGKPGTLGSANPGVLVSDLPLVGTSQFVPAAMRDGFRTNVGFLNATALPSDVLVRLHTGGGNVVAERTFSMPGFGWQQVTDVFGTLGVAPFKGGYVEVVQLTGERLGVYGSNIDNTSGNPTTFQAKTAYAGQRSLFVPSAAHLNGYNGTTWITDVNYLNEGPTGSLGGLAFLPYDHDNTLAQPIQQTFQLGNGEMRTFPDVLLNEFALTGVKGSLTWGTPDGNPHLLWASTFNDRGAEGTFGQATPSIFADTDKLSGDLEGILIGLSQSAVGNEANGYRSAIGLLNTGTSAATFHIDLSDDAGNVLGSLDENVPAMSLLQLDKVYQQVTPNAVNNGRAVIKVTSGQGFAYASLIDNQNGAPTTQYATRRTPFVDPAVQYIQQWFPTNDARFYLSNLEAKAMINGTPSTRSFAPDLAAEFWNDPRVQGAFPNVQAVEQWLRDRADGVPTNSEFCAAFDPLQWTAGVGVRIYDGVSCGPVDFKPGTTPMLDIYNLVKTQFLPAFVRDHPTLYGNLDLATPPSDPWNTQDSN